MVGISQSFSTIGLISLNGSKHGNFDRPYSIAALILDTSHTFKHTFLPSSDVISLYISISHFTCSSIMLDSFSGTSMVSISLPSSMARVIWLAYQSINFFFFHKSLYKTICSSLNVKGLEKVGEIGWNGL